MTPASAGGHPTSDSRGQGAEGAFSESDGKIAFASNRTGDFEIYTINPDGSDVTRLTFADGEDERPAFSPDGSRIVFASRRDMRWNIYVMDADGSNQMRLTNTRHLDRDPDWTPDGSQIVFQRKPIGSKYEVFVMNGDGSDPQNLTNNPTANDIHPMFSPDGSQIVFESERGVDDQIYVMNADGSEQTNITNSLTNDAAPSWSPNGGRIALESTYASPDHDPEPDPGPSPDPEPDPGPSPDPQPSPADLLLAKFDSHDPVRVGDVLTYTLDVANVGHDVATRVRVIDTLPDEVTFREATAPRGCSFRQSQNRVSCSIGMLPAGETESVVIVVAPTSEGVIKNTAEVFGEEHPTPANNTAAEETTVQASEPAAP